MQAHLFEAFNNSIVETLIETDDELQCERRGRGSEDLGHHCAVGFGYHLRAVGGGCRDCAHIATRSRIREPILTEATSQSPPLGGTTLPQ